MVRQSEVGRLGLSSFPIIPFKGDELINLVEEF